MFDFGSTFHSLTSHSPLPWQQVLFERFVVGDIPSRCILPTGLGKTSVIAIWLSALAVSPTKLPRRLVYVVNRRTVVDQTTNEVRNLLKNLEASGLAEPLAKIAGLEHDAGFPLKVSTLRGQFADNREWSANPAIPAVICGTVDMIGSRLLFSGYNVGFKSRPLHAGFLGQGSLIVHDEAHLEAPFQCLLETIEREQERCGDYQPLRIMELTATTRSGASSKEQFSLTSNDLNNSVVRQRIGAAKSLALHETVDDKTAPKLIAELAAKHKDDRVAVLVYVRTLEAVTAIAKELEKTKRKIKLLTGTMRGFERDALAESDEFNRFMKNAEAGETVYLICTSAGEVGVDISADHLVCDLSTFESMAQRFGRLNRYGLRTDSRADVVYPDGFDPKDKLSSYRQATLSLLRRLSGNANPQSIGALVAKLSDEERDAAYSPRPTIVSATDMHFDAWSLTTIRKPMPGRPHVEPYLHGLAEWEPPQTQVAWREEVAIVAGDLLDAHSPEDLLDEFPLKPRELLLDRSDRVHRQLEGIAASRRDLPAWLIDDQANIEITTISALAEKGMKDRLRDCTILLPPTAGGLTDGMLDGASDSADDVGDLTLEQAAIPSGARVRVRSDDPEYEVKSQGLRRIRVIELSASESDNQLVTWDWFEQSAIEGGRIAKRAVSLATHIGDVERHVAQIIAGLNLPEEIAEAIRIAARLHDEGKRRERFQLTLGNLRYPDCLLAKSAGNSVRLPEPFRHEFASVLDAMRDPALATLDDQTKDLALHLIASHLGRARPHFPADEVFDPGSTLAEAEELACETPRRFARLQRRYGRWGLAYMESLLRAADWAASDKPSPELGDQEEPQ